MFVKHKRYIRFITLMIPLFLVFMGMRVPDFSRPHKPKPMRGAVLDETTGQNVLQSIVKIDGDSCITTLPPTPPLAAKEYHPEVRSIHSPDPLLSLSPFPPRAPPASPALA